MGTKILQNVASPLLAFGGNPENLRLKPLLF